MFKTPEYVFKDGALVARSGRVCVTPAGGIHFATPGYDPLVEKTLRRRWGEQGAAIAFDHVAIGADELCRCCNGGRLLPAACFGGGS